MTSRLRCEDCNMVFGSPVLLQKHRSKFCVGTTMEVDILNRTRHLPERRSPSPVSTGRRSTTTKTAQQQKLHEIEDYKKKRARERDLRNLEERILLDSIQQADYHTQGIPGERLNKRNLPRATDPNVRGLQLKYEHLQEQENTLQARAEPPKLKSRKPASRQNLYSAASTNSSVTIYLPDDDDVPRYNPNQDAQAKHLAETHGRQMEFLNSRNRELERQRDDIRRRLEELGRRPNVIIQKEAAPPPPPQKTDISTELLLQQLKDQESRNQSTLDELKRELFYLRDKKEAAPIIQQPPPPPQIIKLLNDSFNKSQVLVENIQENLEELFLDQYSFKRDVAVQYSDMLLHDQQFHAKHFPTPASSARRYHDCRYQTKRNLSALSKISEEGSYAKKKGSLLVTPTSVKSECDSLWQTYLNATTKCRLLSLKTLLLFQQATLLFPGDVLIRRKIDDLTKFHMNTQADEKFSRSEIERPAPQAPVKSKNYTFPVFYGDNLIAEISAVRQAYLQGGGNDPDVLNNMALMLEEAKALEDARRDTRKDKIKDKKVVDVHGTQIQSMEFENERLQRELQLIREQNLLNSKNKDGREGINNNEKDRSPLVLSEYIKDIKLDYVEDMKTDVFGNKKVEPKVVVTVETAVGDKKRLPRKLPPNIRTNNPYFNQPQVKMYESGDKWNKVVDDRYFRSIQLRDEKGLQLQRSKSEFPRQRTPEIVERPEEPYMQKDSQNDPFTYDSTYPNNIVNNQPNPELNNKQFDQKPYATVNQDQPTVDEINTDTYRAPPPNQRVESREKTLREILASREFQPVDPSVQQLLNQNDYPQRAATTMGEKHKTATPIDFYY